LPSPHPQTTPKSPAKSARATIPANCPTAPSPPSDRTTQPKHAKKKLRLRHKEKKKNLNNKHITEYQNYLETRPNKKDKERLLSVSHLNHNFLAIDKLLEFLHQYGMTNAPVPTNYRVKVDEQERINKIEVFTKEEIKTLYNSIPNTYTRFL
jgi:hypothetical protein